MTREKQEWNICQLTSVSGCLLKTHDKREARLEHLSANQRLRLAAETNSDRAARLEHQSANHHLRLAVKTDNEREAIMECVAALMQ